MNNKYNVFVLILSGIEIVIIGFLVAALIGKKQLSFLSFITWLLPQTESPMTINAVSLKGQNFISTNGYAYYYDFLKNSTVSASIAWLDHAVTYRYNNDAFHDRYNYQKEKPVSTFRIMTLGDSFTFGMWVDTGNNFSEQLEDMLNSRLRCPTITSFEVINAGAPSFDLRYDAKRFTDKGAAYSPDAILWFIRGENFSLNTDMYYRLEDEYKEKLTEEPGAYIQYRVSQADPYAASHLAYLHYMDDFKSMSTQEQEAFMQPEVRAITAVHHQSSSSALFLLMPELEEKRYHRILQQLAQSENRVYYRALPAFQTFQPNDYHPTVAGHRKIADALFTMLRSTELSNCALAP